MEPHIVPVCHVGKTEKDGMGTTFLYATGPKAQHFTATLYLKGKGSLPLSPSLFLMAASALQV